MNYYEAADELERRHKRAQIPDEAIDKAIFALRERANLTNTVSTIHDGVVNETVKVFSDRLKLRIIQSGIMFTQGEVLGTIDDVAKEYMENNA